MKSVSFVSPDTPPAPANFRPRPAEIDLSWTPSPSLVSDYEVDQWFPGIGWSAIDDEDGTTSFYPVAGPFDPSATYSFRLDASDVNGNDLGLSNTAVVTTPAFPAAPSSLNGVAASPSAITLSWTESSTNQTGFNVERSDDDGLTWTLLATTPADATSYTDSSGLSEDQSYSYRVSATSNVGNSPYSDPIIAYTQPNAPTNLSAAFVSGGEMDLTWTVNSTALDYSVEHSTDGGATWMVEENPVSTNGIALGATLRYADPGPFNPSSSYLFRVRVNALFEQPYSAYSNVASAETPAFPNAPSGLTATALSDSQIGLNWSDNSSNETGFVLQRSLDGSTWTTLSPIGPNVTTYTDGGLDEATTYYYQICAVNAAGNSAFDSDGWAQTNYTTPVVAVAASAGQSTTTATTDTLSVLGSLPGGDESSLTYVWSVTSGPAGASFNNNELNSAKNTTVTFVNAGTYTFQVSIRNGTASVTSSVQVTVNQVLTSITVLPAATTILPGTTEQLFATAYDQFGNPMNPQPAFNWSATGGGTIDSNGNYTAPSQNGGGTVQVTAGSLSTQTQVTASDANEGVYKVTLGSSHWIDDTIVGSLSVSNSGWIAAASPADAIRQAVTGSVTIDDTEHALRGTASFPNDLGGNFSLSTLTWNPTTSQYTGQIELTFPFEGYEEFFTNVTVSAPPVTGTLGIVESDGSTELPHAQNNSPGGYVKLDDDNDNYQFTTATGTTPVVDNDPTKTSIVGEKDLAIINIHPISTPTQGGYYAMTVGSSNISLWENSDKSVPITAASKLPEDGGIQVFVEGVGLSTAAAQEQVGLFFFPAPGLAAIRVDTADYTVYSIEGPSNVVGLSKFTYTANVPGGANSPAWSGDGAEILPGATGTTARVLWTGAPDVGKIYYSPAPGFRGEFDANVVLVTPSNERNSGNSGGAVDAAAANGFGYATAPTALTWSTTVQVSGPLINGVERGVRFIQVGFTQDVSVTQFNATYADGITLTSNMEGGDYIDLATDPNTYQPLGQWPWYDSTNANTTAYWDNIIDTAGDRTKTLSTKDTPATGVPLQDPAGFNVVSTAIQYAFITTLTVHSTDIAKVSPDDSTYLELAQFGWWLDYSKTAAGYSAVNAITANSWREVTNLATNTPQLPAANTVAANRVFR